MKVSYDPATDTLTVILKQGVTIAESDEDRAGTILDYDAAGNLVSIEILDASQRVTDARKIEYETISPDT
jgi:YD repeat-containing protein